MALGLGVAGIGPGAVQAAEGPAKKPNIIVIVADDLGYGELGCQGQTKEIPTPNIDSLAQNGIRFTNGYVSCPVCSPTRAGLMTGRYQQRFGHEFNPGPAQQAAENFGLPLSETTLPQRLKTAGYATGMVGKWHLGYKPAYHPMKRGFDEFFGFLGGSHSYLDARADKSNPILRGTEPVDEPEYLTDAFAREAVAFIDRHQAEPFFLYLAFNAVHNPLQAPEKYLSRFPSIADRKRRTFAAMLSAHDDAVGAVLGKLRSAGLEGNTLIVYVSDNGGPTPQTTSRNDPLNGRKGQVLEGGIRVPFLMQWKGQIPAGKTYDQPVIALDILPTAMAAAGSPTSAGDRLDGVNLLPFLTGRDSGVPHEALFWRFGPQAAVCKGAWKLVKLPNEPARLYDLAKDIGETTDLAAQRPEVAKELQAALDAWDAQLAKPLWGPRGQAQRRAAR
ncbi:MAG: sulfatase [Isosphaeraceae bacterium]|nr:sulfatase [Isosphaeraceae bacterium]